MKRNFKLFLLSFALIAAFFTSCTNDEPVVEEQNIDESASITASLSQLSLQFNTQGNMIPNQNPTGNIVFDFCFDFVYPLDLSYNNGTTVTVNSLEDLVQVMINSTNDLFVNGIAFPFDVETYDDDADAIVVVTINNEDEFADLLEDCDFDQIDDCECFEVYDPVCVEVEAPNGETFLMTYPNACYAECDGFTEEDFAENCEEDYNCPGGIECFTFNFPLTIITDDDTEVTVNSQEELDNVLYNSYYFDFVYPFDVTLSEDQEVITINSEEEFEDILEECFDYDDECVLDLESLENLLVYCDVFEVEIYNQNEELEDINFVTFAENGELIVNGEIAVTDLGSWTLTETNDDFILTMEGLQNFTLLNDSWNLTDCSFDELEFNSESLTISFECDDDNNPNDCEECSDEEFDPVCVEVESIAGTTEIITFPNACYAECQGFDSEDFIECEDDNVTSECTEDEVDELLVECQFWTVTIGDIEYTYVFGSDGSVNVNENNSQTITSGTWSTSTNPTGIVVVSVATESGNFASDWLFFDCDNPEGPEVVSTANWVTDIESGCE